MNVGPPSGTLETIIPVIIRNNSSDAVSHVDLSAGVMNRAGKVIASGNSQGFAPQNVDPGEASLGFVYFQNKFTLPPGATFDFSFDSQPPSTDPFATADLKVTQANRINGHIIGSATNTTKKTVDGPFGVYLYCFAGDKLTSSRSTFANGPDTLTNGAKVSFDIDLLDASCPKYLVGSSGYYH